MHDADKIKITDRKEAKRRSNKTGRAISDPASKNSISVRTNSLFKDDILNALDSRLSPSHDQSL
jgi:hypothetical protein